MSFTISKQVNLELVKEREKCIFEREELAVWWNGGKHRLVEKRALEKIFFDDPDFVDKIPDSYLSKKELYENGVKRVTSAIKKFRKIQAETDDETIKNINFVEIFRREIVTSSPMGLHFVMFIPTLIGQATEEQQNEWLERAFNCNIIGTYAQTELGHGTFIRGLETRADYDPKTQEFVLNSPTLTAYKWWPVAHTSNYAIVLAQLYTEGKCHGIQPFIVQLRDEDTHMPMPGIDVGNIGSKLGMNFIDNGYLGFKNVRIPRKNMLMKHAQVLADGKFIKSKVSQLTYGTMTLVRVGIVRLVTTQLAKGVTIATRYSVVRHQSPIDPNKPEPQIIDHVTQQLKLFPEIARTLIFKLTADFLTKMSTDVFEELKIGNVSRLPELHALSCCLKAVCSADATKGIETLRLSCGGHGYMESSNFPFLYGLISPACTYEGENTVLLLQTARNLMKTWTQVLKGEPLTPTVAYMGETRLSRKLENWDASVPAIIKIFQLAAANKIRLAFEHLEERKNQGYTQEEAANMTGIEMTGAADLHGRAFLISSAFTEIERVASKSSEELATVLRQLMELYAVDACLNQLGDLLRFADLTERHINKLQVKLEYLLGQIRPNAVGIVDGFDIHDVTLNSALGAYDGNVYERIFAEAQKSPLNQEPVQKSFHLYLKPFMKASL